MSTPPVTSLWEPAANAVRAQFASRPTLESVTRQMLTAAINEKYPALNIDLSNTRLATPYSEGSWSLSPLMPLVMDYLASGTALDFSPIDNVSHYLADGTGNRLGAPSYRPDMKVIEALIKELPWTIPVGLQQALSDYWAEDSDTGVSRWCWLSDVLKDTLSIGAIWEHNLNDRDRETLNQVIQCPEREERVRRYGEGSTYVYCLESTVAKRGNSSTLLTSAFLLVRSDSFLLYRPFGRISVFSSLDAISESVGKNSKRYWADEVRIDRYELDGNVFDTQAALMLNQQLESLAALSLPASIGVEALSAVCQELTDPAEYFRSVPLANQQTLDSLKKNLPEWLLQASTADQTLYRRYSLELALAKNTPQGGNFFFGMMDIREFAGLSMWQQMARDQKRFEQKAPMQIPAKTYYSGDIEMTFLNVVGSGGTIGNPSPVGIVERVTMSLTDLALKNLSGQPGSSFTLRHRLGLTLPAWLTPEYIRELIQQVDIGRTYPQYLQERLLSDTPDARYREQLFGTNLSAQLPLQALEFSLKKENGLTPLGVRYVAALMQPEAADRQVDDKPMTIRHLALLREPEATPDTVSNMFIIEPADMTAGPHLLYRPHYSPALHEFSSRAALLDAISTPGPLQDSVLVWLDDSARLVYSNGGFQEPHFVRYGLGIEHSTIDLTPPVASLSNNDIHNELQLYVQNGKLQQYLYGSNARALIRQADKDSVSNSESRWAALLEGGGLIFNTLLSLPFLRGPVMVTAWLASLIYAVGKDIPALHNQDPVTRELAVIDLLLNLGMALFHVGASVAQVQPKLAKGIKEQVVLSRVSANVAEQWSEPPPAKVIKGIVALPGELPKAQSLLLDFSFASARNRLTPIQRADLSRFEVSYTEPLPEPLEHNTDTGRHIKGLYVFRSKWHALVDGNLYQVRLDAEDVVIVDPSDITRHGPHLKSDTDGKWSLDLRMGLKGGAPQKRIADLRKQREARLTHLERETDRHLSQQAGLDKRINNALAFMERAGNDPLYKPADLANMRQRLESLLQEQRDSYEILLGFNQERADLKLPTPPRTVAVVMEQFVLNVRKSVVLTEMDREALYAKWEQFRPGNPDIVMTITADFEGHLAFVKELIKINERSIRWLGLKDRYLEDIYNLGEPGVDSYQRLTQGRPDKELDAFSVKGGQLQLLALASIKVWEPTMGYSLKTALSPLLEQVVTHSELNALDFSPSERREVLGSLVERYDRTLEALLGIALINDDELNFDYFDKLVGMVKELHHSALQQLTAEQRVTEVEPAATPPKSPPKAAKLQKRVIKTRNRGSLIGELKPPIREAQNEVVEIRSKDNNELLSTYTRNRDVWDAVDAKPARHPVAVRALNVIKGEARKRLNQIESHLQQVDSYRKRSKYPQELEEILQREADRLDSLANEYDLGLQGLPNTSSFEADQTLVGDLRNGAERLKHKGREVRVQLSLDLPPAHGNLQYLLEQDIVEIAVPAARIKLTGQRKDFIQEYAINKKGGALLWYAHFHYAALDTPKQNYAVAHLKTKAQRKQSYYSLLAEAKSPQATIAVHHGQIGKDLAERWFLPLAP